MSIPLTIPDDWTPAQALAVYDKRVFDLVKDFGDSDVPKSFTRSKTRLSYTANAWAGVQSSGIVKGMLMLHLRIFSWTGPYAVSGRRPGVLSPP